MSCTPPRTPSPGNGVTSMPVSVIMIGKKDGTAEPIHANGAPYHHEHGPAGEEGADMGDGRVEEGRHVIFVENKNTNRHNRNINFSEQQIFVANKDTNREAGRPAPMLMALNATAVPEMVVMKPQTTANSPVAIAPKMTLTTAKMIPLVPAAGNSGTATATLFLAPCDSNGQITHFVLTTTAAQQPTPISPSPKVLRSAHLSSRLLVVQLVM